MIAEMRKTDWPVRALIRSRDAQSAALVANGAEVVFADLFDPDQLYIAMHGTQRAYVLPPWSPYLIQGAAAFGDAARAAKLGSILSLGPCLTRPAHPSWLTRQDWLATFAGFMKIGFIPACNLDKPESDQGHARLPEPRFAIDDPRWRASHSADLQRLPIAESLKEGQV
jgi:hypothetical protein